MKKVLILLMISLIFSGCSKKVAKNDLSKPLVYRDGLYYADSISTIPYTGRNKSKMMDQVIEYDVVNGKREGDFIIYYPNKRIQIIGKLSNNKNVGQWKYYYSDGALETVGEFLDDKPAGKWTWYYPNGKIAEEGILLDGKREGVWKSYDSLGAAKILRTYKMDELIDSTSVE